MRAILFRRGIKFRIYLLENDKYIEVKNYFETNVNDSKKGASVRGFIQYINHMATNGYYDLSKDVFYCWKEDDRDKICELKKGKDRLSCFFYPGGKLLIITHFVKKGWKEKGEYRRAITLNNSFNENQRWEE
jgi:hypothetical protein